MLTWRTMHPQTAFYKCYGDLHVFGDGQQSFTVTKVGTQFVGASNELKEIVRGMSWEQIKHFGWPERNIEWRFSPPDVKWYNGATESLVKSVKQ